MEIFYSANIEGNETVLGEEESGHCVKVLRHRRNDEINVVDGMGCLHRCVIIDDSPKRVIASILESVRDWGAHGYFLNMAVCPTKNNDRFEWFVEKATELGVDMISPIIGDRSERKVFKPDRSRKIALSAMKQSLKAKCPAVSEPVSIKDYLSSLPETMPGELRLICCCFEDEGIERISIDEALERAMKGGTGMPQVRVMIGPEGDFSPEEVRLAIAKGFMPVHLGPSRLRTETAAITAVTAVYLSSIRNNINCK